MLLCVPRHPCRPDWPGAGGKVAQGSEGLYLATVFSLRPPDLKGTVLLVQKHRLGSSRRASVLWSSRDTTARVLEARRLRALGFTPVPAAPAATLLQDRPPPGQRRHTSDTALEPLAPARARNRPPFGPPSPNTPALRERLCSKKGTFSLKRFTFIIGNNKKIF